MALWQKPVLDAVHDLLRPVTPLDPAPSILASFTYPYTLAKFDRFPMLIVSEDMLFQPTLEWDSADCRTANWQVHAQIWLTKGLLDTQETAAAYEYQAQAYLPSIETAVTADPRPESSIIDLQLVAYRIAALQWFKQDGFGLTLTMAVQQEI